MWLHSTILLSIPCSLNSYTYGSRCTSDYQQTLCLSFRDNQSCSVDNPSTLHFVLCQQIVFTLEQLHGITNKPADTPNERAFQEAFKDQLECAIKSLKYPDNPEQPQQSWAPFKQVRENHIAVCTSVQSSFIVVFLVIITIIIITNNVFFTIIITVMKIILYITIKTLFFCIVCFTWRLRKHVCACK